MNGTMLRHGSRRIGRKGAGTVVIAAMVALSTSSAWALKPPPGKVRTVKSDGQDIPVIAKMEKIKLIGDTKKDGSNKTPAKAPSTTKDGKKLRPVIKCEKPVHDFGTVWVGPVLRHTFIIKNEGNAPLEITRVKPSCGCTIAGNYPRVIQPGESGEFPFSVSSKRLHNRFEKGITITSTDPVTPTLRLRLRGEVKQYVDVSPPNIYFGKITSNKPVERVATITNNTEKPLELKIKSEAGGGMETELKEVEKGQKYELRVAYKPPFQTGIFRRQVILETNVDAQKTVTINVRGSVPERLEVSPATVTLGARSALQNTQTTRPTIRIVRLTNYGEKPVRLLEAKADDPKIQTKISEQRPGKSYSVQIEIPPDYNVPPTGRKLVLKTDDPEKPTIEVPIRSLAARTKTAANNKPRRRPAEELVGQMAPSFSAKTIEGKPVGTDTFKGKITVLDFFAVNCPFCARQIPRLETVRKQYASKGIRFVAISQTLHGKRYDQQQAVDKLNTLGFKGELVVDPDNTIGPLFKAVSYPTMVVIGKTGKIEAVNVGNVADLESRMKTQLDALLAGKAIPKIEAKTAARKPQQPQPRRGNPTDLVGKPAPKFSFTTLKGETINNDTLKKHPATIINVVAANCPYCKKQTPRLEKIRQKYEAKGVKFVNLVQTMRKKFSSDEVVNIFQKVGSNIEIAHDPDNKVGPLFNARGFPTMIVLGKSGKVEAVNVGNLADLEKRVEAQLDALLAGKPIPQFATAPPKPRRRPAEELVGKPAPAFKLATYDGKTISSDDFKNHPATVLNFVAPNCGFCKRQVPNVEKVRAEYEAKGVRFVNVQQTMRKQYSKDEAYKIFKDIGSNLEFAPDAGNKVGRLYRATSFPTMVVVDRNGKIAHVNIGAKPNIEAVLRNQLDALIKKAGS